MTEKFCEKRINKVTLQYVDLKLTIQQSYKTTESRMSNITRIMSNEEMAYKWMA